MIYLLLASPSKNKPGLAIGFSNVLEFGSSFHKFENAEVIPCIDKIEVFATQNASKLGKDEDLTQRAALIATHALLSTQPLLWDEEKFGSLCADIYLECDINTEIQGDSGGLAYSLRLLEELTSYDADGSQRFNDTHTTMLQLVIGATGEIDQVGQISRVEDVAVKLEAFVVKLQQDWSEIQTATRQENPRIVFLLPEENLAELDPQILNQAKEKLYDLSPNVDIVGVERLSTAIQTLVGDRFPVAQQQQSPYKGLNAFDPQDRILFFGREKKIKKTIKKLTQYCAEKTVHRHCIVFGDSGAGKSSFVKAGLLPQLSNQTHSTLQNWIILKPGDGQGRLLEHFIESLRPTLDSNDQEKLFNLPWCTDPQEAFESFTGLYTSARTYSSAPHALVWVIDQAEELLRMPEAENDINQLIAVLQAFSNFHLTKKPNKEESDLVCWLISTIREAEYENYKSLLALENEKTHYFACPLAVLDPSEDIAAYQAIIENPARLRGIRVEPELTQHLLSVITELKNPLPTLEYTLDELYQHAVKTRTLKQGLTLKAFKDESIIGSMSDLITRHAQALLDKLKKDVGIRKQIPEFFSLLLGVDKIHGLAYPRPAKIETFKKSSDLYRLYQAFVDHRFLLESDKNVRFSHEVLIREWSEVQQWAKETAQREQSRKTRRLVIGLVFSIGLMLVASYAAYYANQQTDIAKVERDNALIIKSRFLADLSLKHTKSGNARLGALLALEALPDYSKTEDKRRPYLPEAEKSLYATLNKYIDIHWFRHSSGISHVAFSPDGSKIVTASSDKTARVWDVEKGQIVAVLNGHTNWVKQATFSSDGTKIVTASEDGTARVWDADTGQSIHVLKKHSGSVNYAEFSPDGTKIVTSSEDASALLWNAKTGQVVAILNGHTKAVKHATFSLDGTKIVTASWDETARVWDADTGRVVAVLKEHTERVGYATFSPDGTKIVTASFDKTARLWDTKTGQVVAILNGHTSWVNHATFSPDGSKISTVSNDETARVWDAETGQVIAVLNGHSGYLDRAIFSPDGSQIVTNAWDNARIWDADSGREVAVLNGHTNWVNYAAFSPDGTKIVTVSRDKTARVWTAETRHFVTILNGHTDKVNHAAFSPNGTKIVTASDDNTARIWNAEVGQVVAVLNKHTARVSFAAFSPNGRKIVTASIDDTARVWDAKTGKVMVVLGGHTSHVYHAIFSPDGKKIATSSYDNTTRLWDAKTGEVVAILKGHTSWVGHAAFSPDGTKIVTASDDKTARVWNAKTGEVLAVLNGHTRSASHAIFSPDGTKIVTASWDKTARVWDADTGQVLAVLNEHTGWVSHAAFSPDGTKIVTASSDKTARVWNADTGQVVAVLNGSKTGVNHVAFSSDGHKIVTASYLTAHVWDTNTGQAVAIMTGHTNDVNYAAFFPDGSQIITASNDGTARLWNVYNTEELVKVVKTLDLQPLTPEERRQNYLE